jgi:reverse transcriptase-like protein
MEKRLQKADRSSSLYGNLIDTCVRNTQDQQTLGIPVGPRSSHLIAETVGAALDRELQDELGPLSGTRYVDDFHLYFRSRSETENALAMIERVAKSFELEVNAQDRD